MNRQPLKSSDRQIKLDKARYFTKGTTGWTHIEDFITCRIDAELKNTHLLHEKEEKKYFHPHPLLGLTFMNWIKRINRLTNRKNKEKRTIATCQEQRI